MTDPQAHILWEGTQLAHHSFALTNRSHCTNIIDWGAAELTIIPYERDQFSAAGDAVLERLVAHDVRSKGLNLRERSKRPHIWVRHLWPPKPKPPGKDKWVVMQPWEYSLFPKKYLELLCTADEVWTPSRFSRNAFVDSGLDPDTVHLVPCGVDAQSFTPQGGTLSLPTDKRFKLLFVGGTIYRKGIDILLQAYTKSFSGKDDVCLVIKDTGVKTLYRGQTAEQLIKSYQTRTGSAEIVYLDTDLPHARLADLYRAADVFVSPYRGEGFSIPTLEAMACGIPVIVTGGGSTDDFVDAEVGWQIPSVRRSIGTNVYGDALPGEGFLLEPDELGLAELMRHALGNPTEVVTKGRLAARRASGHWTWQHATLKALERIDAICGTTICAQAASRLDAEYQS